MQAESEAGIQDAVADKGCHAARQLEKLNVTLGIRAYIPEPKRKSLETFRGVAD